MSEGRGQEKNVLVASCDSQRGLETWFGLGVKPAGGTLLSTTTCTKSAFLYRTTWALPPVVPPWH